MRRFDTVIVVDWSAGKRSRKKAKKDAIWIGIARAGGTTTEYVRSRLDAESRLNALIREEQAAQRKALVALDFPFGYPKGFARDVVCADDSLLLWDWLSEEIEDPADGKNNRFAVAEKLNARFDGLGPFWGKTFKDGDPRDLHPGVPYRKAGIVYDRISERRMCDLAAKASSSCFQLAFPPTVGGQALTGLPVLSRLRRLEGVAVWPFQEWQDAPTVLAEIWPGLIEPAVKSALGDGDIRDEVQVRLLARALRNLPPETLYVLMTDLPEEAVEEAWILGIGASERLCAPCPS